MPNIRVFGKTYSIQKVTNHPKNHGDIDYENSTITYDSMQSLLHEALHAIFRRIGVNQAISHDAEELIVESTSTFLVENFDIKLKRK